MKKSLAIFGASAMGMGLVGAGAVPAVAADTTEPCADFSAQIAATGDLTDNWYQSCVPQYGAGKAEFTIVADEDDPAAEFPEGFVPLNELAAEAITSTADIPALQGYYDVPPPNLDASAPIVALGTIFADSTTQQYTASVIAPVESIAQLDLEDAPAEAAPCLADAPPYTGGWVATFGSVDTTFSQTIDDEAWNYTITAAPPATYFFATFSDGLQNWCLTDGVHTETSSDSLRYGGFIFELVSHGPTNMNAATPDESFVSLGVFARDVPEVPVAPETPAAVAQLPATGSDVAPLVIAAGAFTAFTAFGLALLGFVNVAARRRPRV